MPDCTVSQVLQKTQSILGDPNAEITQEIVDDYGTAYLDLIHCLMKITAQEVTREVYFTLPPFTNVINPASLGVTDFAEPRQLWERGNIQTAAIASTTDGTPITVTFVNPVPVNTGAQIELQGIQGVPGWVNRDWFVTITGANTVTLNGSVTCGSSGTGGTAMWGIDAFTPMTPGDVQPNTSTQQVGLVLGYYRWTENQIIVPGASAARQLWIEYLANGVPPVSGPIGLCEGRELNFLAYWTGALFAPKRGIAQGPQLAERAVGPSGEPDGSGGMLRQLIIPIIQQQQQRPQRSGRFRPRRPPFPFVG